MKELAGPASSSPKLPRLPKTEAIVLVDKPIFSQQFDLSHLASNDDLGFSSENLPYRVFDKSGKFITSGQTNQDGLTDRILTNEALEIVVLVGDDGWQIEERFEDDPSIDDDTEAGEIE